MTGAGGMAMRTPMMKMRSLTKGQVVCFKKDAGVLFWLDR